MPDPFDPAAWNRFGYVYGNPTNYTDPSGHIGCPAPWDCLDIAGFVWSAYDFYNEPTWANAGWLALDTVGLLPIIPSIAAVRHAGKLGLTDEAVQVVRGVERSTPIWDANVGRWRDATGRFAKAPDVLDRSWIRWSQESVSGDVYWQGAGRRIPISEAAERLKAGEIYQGDPLLVFRKTPEMNKWKAATFITSDGRKYTGSFANLEDGVIYSINNRTLTVFNVAKVDRIPVRWATKNDILKFSYQFDTPNYGVFIQFRYY